MKIYANFLTTVTAVNHIKTHFKYIIYKIISIKGGIIIYLRIYIMQIKKDLNLYPNMNIDG